MGCSIFTIVKRLEHKRSSFCGLAQHVDTVILDHHLMRSTAGAGWLDALSEAVGKKVYCAADYMGRRRQLLESERVHLYEQMPVPDGWHDAYARGRVDTDSHLEAIDSRTG
jgi:predicted metallo-beta-lactamase superfamily hydrolase